MLRFGLWRATVGLLLLTAVTRADIAPLRDGFEKDAAGKTPAGWVLTTPGYRAEVMKGDAREGQQCVRIRVQGDEPKGQVAVLLRSVDAKPYRGRMIRMRGSVRIEPAGPFDRVQLWLRVNRAGNQMGFFDNMDDRPVRNRAWGESEIEGDVALDAEKIVFGVLVFGGGPTWIDDVRLEDAGPVLATPKEPARPLSGRGLDNLVAFTRLLGYVRHFHPSDEAASTDWDAMAVAAVRAIESAKDPADLARRLETLFRPLGPTIRVFPTGAAPSTPDDLKSSEKAREIVAWDHFGYGHDSKQPFQIYKSRRQRWRLTDGRRPDDAPDPATAFRADLGGGVSCLVPLALYADDAGTLPHATKDRAKAAPSRDSGDDRATRLADVALAWNVLQHFYPYFDVVTTDWSAALRRVDLSGPGPRWPRIPGDASANGRRLARRPWRRLLDGRQRPGRLPTPGLGLDRRSARRDAGQRSGQVCQARRHRPNDRRQAGRGGAGRRRAIDLRGDSPVAAPCWFETPGRRRRGLPGRPRDRRGRSAASDRPPGPRGGSAGRVAPAEGPRGPQRDLLCGCESDRRRGFPSGAARPGARRRDHLRLPRLSQQAEPFHVLPAPDREADDQRSGTSRRSGGPTTRG